MSNDVHSYLTKQGFKRQSTGAYNKPLRDDFILQVRNRREDVMFLHLVHTPTNTLVESATLCTEGSKLPPKLASKVFDLSTIAHDDPEALVACGVCESPITTRVFRNRNGVAVSVRGCTSEGCKSEVHLRKVILN